MKFRIPFTIGDPEKLKKRARMFEFLVKNKRTGKIQTYLDNSGIKLTEREYLTIVLRTITIVFVFLYLISATTLLFFKIKYSLLLALGIAFMFSFFVLFSQINYPKIYNSRRVKEIDKNLISVLQDIYVQLSSGIPLFNILVNISSSNYGALSEEFQKAVKKINAGSPQIEVLEELGEKNTSQFFKRTLWQLSNGMRAGSDISIVIEESIKNLNEEQLLQIQNYGNKLNPLIMFYMVISVILPALSIAFLTIISSMLGFSELTTKLLFVGLLVFAIFLQIMFLGMVRTIKPSLL